MSAAVAAAVPGMSNHRADKGDDSNAEADRLAGQLGILEDENATPHAAPDL